MANRFARATGNFDAVIWSDTPTGAANASFAPVSGDACMANGFTVTINVLSLSGLQLRNDTTGSATAGGQFAVGVSGGTYAVDVYAGSTATAAVVFSRSSPDTATFVGNLYAGSAASAHALNVTGSGTVNHTGNGYGGAGTNAAGIVMQTNNGTVNATGNYYSGAGGQGVRNTTASGVMTVNGTAYSANAAAGAINTSTGTLRVTNAVAQTGSTAAAVVGNNNSGITTVENMTFVAGAFAPISGAVTVRVVDPNSIIMPELTFRPTIQYVPATPPGVFAYFYTV
jgi:hypothetical protein